MATITLPAPSAMPVTTGDRAGRAVRAAGAYGAAAFAGLTVGGLTSFGQTFLPAAVNSLANSTSGWVLFAVGIVWLLRFGAPAAALGGPIALTGMMAGYYLVTEARGFAAGSLLADPWFWAGFAAGPVVGVSAALLRRGSGAARAWAIVPPAVVLIADGLLGLTLLTDTTSPVYWTLALVGGIAFLGWQMVRQRLRPLLAASVVVLVAVGVVLLEVAYWLVFTLPHQI